MQAKTRRQLGLVALLLALIISSLPGCADSHPTSTAPLHGSSSISFSPNATIVMFRPGEGQWTVTTFGQAEPGSEFYWQHKFLRVYEAGKARVVPQVDSSKLFEADRPYDSASRRPTSNDIVQILGDDGRPLFHELYAKVKPGTAIRFQGVAYSITSKGIERTDAPWNSRLQRIRITERSWQHITDRHTAGGTMNAGKSVFREGVDIRSLIMDAQLLAPVPQAGGNSARIFDAGQSIGTDRATGRQTSTYTVITTRSGQLVTAFPGLP